MTDSAAAPASLVARLRAAGCVFAEEEAALLVQAATTPAELERLAGRRVAGVPLEQVLGWAEFCGLRIALEPGVFVPRRRTALLVAEAARRARPGDVVVDLCCGSGAVGAAVRAAVPGIELHAADLDDVAVSCARRNLPGAEVHRGDLFDALPEGLRGRVAVLACNAPYVPSEAIALMPPEAREHEPRGTLDGGADGLRVLARVVAGAGRWLAPGGAVLFEVGEQQVPVARGLVADAGLRPHVARDPSVGAIVVGGVLTSEV
jgi:release factor glutamine methyltransferase